MRPSFHPRMVNGPFDDPGLFIPFFFEKRAMIFDAGELYSLSARDILKISHVFVTHTHIDHFTGFDRLLRLFLGREKKLCIYGPEGFLKNIEGKLAGYSWNLVKNYTHRFAFQATEVRSDHILSKEYPCQNRFHPTGKTTEQPFDGVLLREPALCVSSVILDHGIPCLGFSIKERFHVNIIKDRLAGLGLDVGPWLREFKEALFNRSDPNSVFEVTLGKGNRKPFVLGDLAKEIAIISPGQKITYITDVVYSKSNSEKMIEFAKGSDHLFIEAAFLDKERDMARQKYHLTARQAGDIAGRACVRQFTLFHFSPRYTDMAHLLEREAREAYVRQLSVVSG